MATQPSLLYIGVDNQTVFRALLGGQCYVRNDLKKCLDGVLGLQQEACSVKGPGTESHMAIAGNEQADKLANQRQNRPDCTDTNHTLTCLRLPAQRLLMDECTKINTQTPNPNPTASTRPTSPPPILPSDFCPTPSLRHNRA